MEDVSSPSPYEIVSLEVHVADDDRVDTNVEDLGPSHVIMPIVSTAEEAIVTQPDLTLNLASTVEEEGAVEFKTEALVPGEMGGFELDQFVGVGATEVTSMVPAPAPDGAETHLATILKGEEEGAQLATILKTEVVETGSGQPLAQGVPQQYIILTRPAEGGPEPVEVQGLPSKFIRFDGADGQTYVLAVTEEIATEVPAKALQAQQIVSAKDLKLNPKHSAVGVSGVSQPSGPASSSRSKTGHNASTDGINQAWFTTRGDKNALQRVGLEWKQGQWTKEEVAILEDNINSYCKNHDIKDPAEVIFEMSKDERKDFYRTIALGIHRPLFSVYRRVTRMYDRKNHRGKYSATEMKHLRVLRAKHGNDWAAIGVALGRSASSVKDKCRLMKDNCKSGKWYPEEEERLAEAVYKLTGLKPSDSITSGLSWASVAEHVGTRSEKQCRTKWLNYLNWKQQGGADWTRDDDQQLIERVSEMNVTSDSDIDWETLSKDWKSVRSPQWLRGKWWALKRHIVDYNKLSYPDLLDQMKQVIYWNLKPKTGTVRPAKLDLGGSPAQGSVPPSPAELFKNCIPVSLTTSVDSNGALALSYCPSEEDGGPGFQTFEVLPPHWRPHILGGVTPQGSAGTEQATAHHGIINGEGHIIVQAITPELAESIQLNGQQQVIISPAGGVDSEDGTAPESMTIQVTRGLVQPDQDLTSLSAGDGIHETEMDTSFETGGEEIVTVSEFHGQPVTSDQDIMTHDVFETVTSDAGGDLVMGVASPPHASRIMTSLKDPILMCSSDVECEKSQNAELTDENTELD